MKERSLESEKSLTDIEILYAKEIASVLLNPNHPNYEETLATLVENIFSDNQNEPLVSNWLGSQKTLGLGKHTRPRIYRKQ
jgi:hypothetical protein